MDKPKPPDSNAVATTGEVLSLTRAALDLVNSSNPINKLANTIVKWLGRECIGEADFNYCVDRCRGLAYPNKIGLELREKIHQKQTEAAKAGGLQLVASGAIGRWMAFTQDHVWMVTTVAAATRFHKVEFAKQLLCEMALASTDSSSDETSNYYAYSVHRARLSGVLSKIVDSIYLNVVTAGHTVGSLPEALQQYCVHLAEPGPLARIILKISRSSSDLMLLCGRFQGDILLWVLTHFDGGITVSIAGKEVYSREPLRGNIHFKMVVQNLCTEQNCREVCHRIELLDLSSGSWKRILDATDDCSKVATSLHRHDLYSVQLPGVRLMLNKEEKFEAHILAQRFVQWILERPVVPTPTSKDLTFDVDCSNEPSQSSTRIADLLLRSPGILNAKQRATGKVQPIVFKEVESDPFEGSDFLYEDSYTKDSVLCACFPALDDFLNMVSHRCSCRICRDHGSIDLCKDGCLRTAAMEQLLMLIANAIADGFGATDVAGTYAPTCNDLVRTILHQLVDGMLWWVYWFDIAASIVLGYQPTGINARSRHEGVGALVAVQLGSLVAAARWLDLSKKIRLKQCFAMEVAEGRIPGSEENLAFVFSEVKMELSCNLSMATTFPAPAFDDLFSGPALDDDASAPLIEHAVIGTPDPIILRLITFVSTEGSQRIVDPADALLGTIRSKFLQPGSNPCQQHELPSQDRAQSSAEEESLLTWSFSELLSSWEIENRDIFLSKTLDSDLKVNVALSLSSQGCFVLPASSCLQCLHQSMNDSPFGPSQRRIIVYKYQRSSLVRLAGP